MNFFGKKAPSADPLQSARNKLSSLVTTHLRTLAMKRAKGITVDPYGNIDGSKWIEESQYFLDKVVRPELSDEQANALANHGLTAISNELIETPVRNECKRIHDSGERDLTILEVDPVNSPIKRRSSGSSPGQRELPSRNSTGNKIVRGLIIRSEPLDRILSGQKIWEMRSNNTKFRETIGLIQKGSKALFGVADIVESRGPLTRDQMIASFTHHGITTARLDLPEVIDYRYAWVLQNVRKLKTPIPYHHKGGVQFALIDEFVATKVAEALKAT